VPGAFAEVHEQVAGMLRGLCSGGTGGDAVGCGNYGSMLLTCEFMA